MIGQVVIDKNGNPVDGNGKSLTKSAYQPPPQVMDLYARTQRDYQQAYSLQHRAFDEFDGLSLLDRARRDQQTFAAFVGAQYVPQHKRWRWRGRKNTARNKLIGILAHIIAGIVYPMVRAKNDQNEEEKWSAKVMQILIEDHLQKAGYEMQFLYTVLSALVNPASIVHVEYVEAMQRVKQRMATGAVKVVEIVDDLISGLAINVVPVDEFLVADFFTPTVQRQPFNIRVRRISHDEARAKHAGKFYGQDGKDLFDHVVAGKTRVYISGTEGATLFDIDWTEADANFVQETTFMYRGEDLEVVNVGGVFLVNEQDVLNTNPFAHRRFTLLASGEWLSVPVYPYGKGVFEPIDPTGRFFYGKSGAFKEYWDSGALDKAYQLLHDGMYLDVIKPTFLAGVNKMDSTVMVPGAVITGPQGATMSPYSLGPNLAQAMNVMQQNATDMSASTIDKLMEGQMGNRQTAFAVNAAMTNAKVMLGLFGFMLGNLIEQVGALTMDCVIQYATVGELDASVPEALAMRYKTFLAHGKEGGKKITNKIVFTDRYYGRPLTKDQVREREWELHEKAGPNQYLYEVNPRKFAHTIYTTFVDADKITMRAMGVTQAQKELAFEKLMDARVLPYVDAKAVVEDFVIDEYSDGDPERYKKKGSDVVPPGSTPVGPMPGEGAPQPAQGAQPSPLTANRPGMPSAITSPVPANAPQ